MLTVVFDLSHCDSPGELGQPPFPGHRGLPSADGLSSALRERYVKSIEHRALFQAI
jgi:hypothetical protein